MITDSDERPKVNSLPPHIRSSAGKNLPRKSNAIDGQRPSLMQAMEQNGSFQTNKNFIEQNKNTMKGSKVEAAHRKDYGTGKLPSLGLSKYVGTDFDDDTRNPFKVQQTTEKMLVMRELEREYQELNKYQKDTLRVHEKMISTRVDRQGALRQIEQIAALKKPKKSGASNKKHLAIQDGNADDSENTNKQKLNIFDAQDSTVLKHETLARIGLDDVVVNQQDNMSDTSRLSSNNSIRLKPIDYLNKTRQQKETAREFIMNSRQILMAQISINDKTEETELLKEYIIMEKEKLDEGRKTFQEDKDKYEKFKQDLQAKSNETEEEVRMVSKKIEALQGQINLLKKEENQLISQESKCHEDLQLLKRDKTFLDLLAISDARKQIRAKKNGKKFVNQHSKDSTFLTTVSNQGPNKSFKQSKGGKGMETASHEVTEELSPEEQILLRLTKGTRALEQIDIQNEYYSDDDEQIYFKEKELIEHLFRIEEVNLFDINQCQNDEERLEEIKKDSQNAIAQMKKKLQDQEEQINQKMKQKVELELKNQFYQKAQGRDDLKNSESKQQPQQSFIQYLVKIDAKKEQIEKILSNIGFIMQKLEIKLEDVVDQTDPFRKLEIKFQELIERRAQAVKTQVEDIRQIEKDNLDKRKIERNNKKKEEDEAENAMRNKNMLLKNQRKAQMTKNTGKRDAERSTKPPHNKQEEVKPEIDQDEVDMQLYLGFTLPAELRATQKLLYKDHSEYQHHQ